MSGRWCLHCALLEELDFATSSMNKVCNKQSFSFVTFVLEHPWAPHLIWTYQLWAGLQKHMLTDTQLWPWIPDSWLSHLWNLMQTNHVQISYDSWNVLPLCTQDWFIMDDLIDQDLPWFKLECLNACWMHLQMTTLAEITN